MIQGLIFLFDLNVERNTHVDTKEILLSFPDYQKSLRILIFSLKICTLIPLRMSSYISILYLTTTTFRLILFLGAIEQKENTFLVTSV